MANKYPNIRSEKASDILDSLRRKGLRLYTCEKEEIILLGMRNVIHHNAYATEKQILDAEPILNAIHLIPAGYYNQANNEWPVTDEGDLVCKDRHYLIEKERLTEMGWNINWISHMAEKNWVNLNSFIPAYLLALKRAGVKTLTIDVDHNQICPLSEE